VAPPTTGRKIGVLLNGTEEAERVLPPVIAVARGCGAALLLIWVVPTAATLPADRAASGVLVPRATRAILDLEADAAAGYLDGVASRLREAGMEVTTSVVRGDPAGEAVVEAERAGVDLLALATHGRGGLGGIWSGSVGARVLGRSVTPLLLVPAGVAADHG
jgi:nucleotide-binding universal stress UspA family protein